VRIFESGREPAKAIRLEHGVAVEEEVLLAARGAQPLEARVHAPREAAVLRQVQVVAAVAGRGARSVLHDQHLDVEARIARGRGRPLGVRGPSEVEHDDADARRFRHAVPRRSATSPA
jgi:hypothetical protein